MLSILCNGGYALNIQPATSKVGCFCRYRGRALKALAVSACPTLVAPRELTLRAVGTEEL